MTLMQPLGSIIAQPIRAITDTERMDWMIFNSAQVRHANDDEFCWVYWSDRDGSYETKFFVDAREAVDAAIRGEFTEC